MTDENILATLALTQIPGLGSIGIRNLLTNIGNAADVFARRKELPELVPGVTPRLVAALDYSEAFTRAEQELAFARRNNIACLPFGDPTYPSRLIECDDAPSALFFKGDCDLNALRIISIVGTRNATDYGKQICARFVNELKELCPDTLIVSGLAYGIDIHAHRASLDNGLPTIGVLAHGLDRIYPPTHRQTAIEMLKNGGLLSEYFSGTNPDRQNFVRRNRIVAGMSDATIVIESATKGGALITADIAGSYHRECFAFPGRIHDESSQGCNKLIRENKATLIQNAEDFVNSISWDRERSVIKNIPIQRQLFLDLTEEEEKVVTFLQEKGDQQINSIVIHTDIPINRLNAILFELEMKGVLRVLAGGVYQLLN